MRGLNRATPPASARTAYRESFVEKVHILIEHGYARLVPADLADEQEPAITGLLVKAIQDAMAAPHSPSWMDRFAVRDDPPVSTGKEKGKSRPRVDIEIERTQAGPRPAFQFEAKRLTNKSSVSRYLGRDGLGSFLSRRYGVGQDDAGMLGYVQTPDATTWAKKIEEQLKAARRKYLLPENGDCWTKRKKPLGLTHSFQSPHSRSKQALTVHHTLLVCY
jgi:hypothetical protein